jgi:aspartate carbamoyltransferase catalytic subunit
MTIRRHLAGGDPVGKDLAGLDIMIVGDVLHSRVARSGVDLFTTLGARVSLVAPATLLPVGVETWNCDVFLNLDQALAAAPPDALMMLRVQRERMSSAGGGFFPSPQEYRREYGLDAARLARLPEHGIVLHPGPMNRGLEITSGAADGPRSVIVEQVANGVAVRMAVLYLTLTGAKDQGTMPPPDQADRLAPADPSAEKE